MRTGEKIPVRLRPQLRAEPDGHYPKVISQDMVDRADAVFTMGCSIDESCPAVFVPSEDWGLEDPTGRDIHHVRRIRDQIEAKVQDLISCAP